MWNSFYVGKGGRGGGWFLSLLIAPSRGVFDADRHDLMKFQLKVKKRKKKKKGERKKREKKKKKFPPSCCNSSSNSYGGGGGAAAAVMALRLFTFFNGRNEWSQKLDSMRQSKEKRNI